MRYVLLVDDEPAVTTALEHEVDWDSLGLSVIAKAKSGLEALNIIQNQAVDIVITDIRMADMDGLSLVQQIFRMNQNIQTIIVSGYAEFSYAQKALSYGAIGYCLKPIEYGELTRFLQNAIRKLENSKRSLHPDDLLDAIYTGNETEICNHLEHLGFCSKQYYVAVSVSKNTLPISKNNGIFFQLGHRLYGYIVTTPFSPSTIKFHLSAMRCSGFAYLETTVPIHKLGSVIRQLSERALHFFFEPNKKIFTGAPSTNKLSCSKELSRLLSANNANALITLLKDVKDNSALMTLNSAWQIYNMFTISDIYSSIVTTDNIFTPEQLVFTYGTFQNMIDTIIERLQKFSPHQSQDSLSNTALFHMVQYIDAHFTEGCSIQQLATEMNMNANYLGRIFKSEIGKPYTTYITELRIEKAKEMLASGNLSIGEIATSLGFNDYFYFLKSFKRVTGMTPKQYRQQLEDFFLHDFDE